MQFGCTYYNDVVDEFMLIYMWLSKRCLARVMSCDVFAQRAVINNTALPRIFMSKC